MRFRTLRGAGVQFPESVCRWHESSLVNVRWQTLHSTVWFSWTLSMCRRRSCWRVKVREQCGHGWRASLDRCSGLGAMDELPEENADGLPES